MPVLARMLAAAVVMLAVASCSHLTPLGPAPPQPRHLGSPIVFQAMRAASGASAGQCPAGAVAFNAPPGVGFGYRPISAIPAGPPTATPAPVNACYSKLGRPVTITSAAVSPVVSFQPPTPQGGQPAPVQYGFAITLTTAGAAALTAITTRAFHSQGYLDISVAGKIWLIPGVPQPFTSPIRLFLGTRSRTLRLRGVLVPPS